VAYANEIKVQAYCFVEYLVISYNNHAATVSVSSESANLYIPKGNRVKEAIKLLNLIKSIAGLKSRFVYLETTCILLLNQYKNK
jgi:hypothetical protein